MRPVSALRRGLLAVAAAALLAGCGWSPLYAPSSSGGDGPAVRGLSEISVDVIPDRPGQLLRQALQARFYGAGTSRASLYVLHANFGLSSDSFAVRQDNTATRARLIGATAWTLTASDPRLGTVASGTARVVDGYNIFDQQYFSADLAAESAQRRIAEALADRVTLQLAAYFKKAGME